MAEVFEVFELPGDGPIKAEVLATVIATVQDRLDLLTVLQVRYGREVEVAGERWKTQCFLPSAVEEFAGSCAEQDATEQGGAIPTNLWVSEGDQTRVWRCHSCGRRGDVVDLIEAADELKRTPGQIVSLSAVRVAANLAGVAYVLDQREPDDRDGDEPGELVAVDRPRKIVRPPKPVVDFARARAINARAAKHWHEFLSLGPGYAARAELKRRRVTKEQRSRYLLGYAPAEWRSLVDRLPKAVRNEADVLGLIGISRQGECYDRYRDRLIFPYCEPARDERKESITGFAGRDLSGEDQAPKWYNSRNVEGVWVKGAALLGLLQARNRMQAQGLKRAVVGEGGWEVLAFDRIEAACVGLVAAPMSTDHVHLLATVLGAERVTIAGDGDEAGRRGVATSLISSLKYGYTIADLDVIDPEDGVDAGKWGETKAGMRKLVAAYENPTAVDVFLAGRGGVFREQQKRALVKLLPDELACEMAALWKVTYEREEDTEQEELSPAAAIVQALEREPELAKCLDEGTAAAVFAADPLALRKLGALDFGEKLDSGALPPHVRKPWLTLYADYLSRELVKHGATDGFAAGQSHANFQAWYNHGDNLRRQTSKVRKQLATLQS